MRLTALAGVFVVALAAPAMAYENFIPSGTGYSSEVDSVPAFSTEKSRVNTQADIYETEIYRAGREAVEQESRLKQFFSDGDSTGADTNIDY